MHLQLPWLSTAFGRQQCETLGFSVFLVLSPSLALTCIRHYLKNLHLHYNLLGWVWEEYHCRCGSGVVWGYTEIIFRFYAYSYRPPPISPFPPPHPHIILSPHWLIQILILPPHWLFKILSRHWLFKSPGKFKKILCNKYVYTSGKFKNVYITCGI